jgi:hypothetical protein
MFCEFPTTCLNCGTSFVVSAPMPNSVTALPDGSSFDCKCPKCGASRGGLVPNFEPHSLIDVRSADSVEGRLI